MGDSLSRIACFVVAIVLLLAPTQAWALAIDLNDFIAPDGNVTVSADGSQALFNEDPFANPISLQNPNLLIPVDAVSMSFNYTLEVPALNEDYFDFYIDDLSTPEFAVGGYDPLPPFVPLVFSGTHEVDVTGYAGTTVPVIFHLLAWDWELDSTLTISNAQIVQRGAAGEPASWLLLGAGMVLLGATRRHYS